MITKKRIEGVQIKSLKWIPDERGQLMEILRCDDPEFEEFGQVYITTGYPGVVKAWHYHEKQADNMVVVKGMAKVVLCDHRRDSSTFGWVNEFFAGESNPILIHIPIAVLHGFKAYGSEPAYVLNIPTQPYNHQDPDEFRIDPYGVLVDYDWILEQG